MTIFLLHANTKNFGFLCLGTFVWFVALHFLHHSASKNAIKLWLKPLNCSSTHLHGGHAPHPLHAIIQRGFESVRAGVPDLNRTCTKSSISQGMHL